MAKMIPSTPRFFNKNSLEGDVFNYLSKLPEDYTVIHSMKISWVNKRIENMGTGHENIKEFLSLRESDFVIYNKNKGLLFLEIKNGALKYTDGRWFYDTKDGLIELKHDGPYRQAEGAMNALLNKIKEGEDRKLKQIKNKIKFCYGVWLLSLSEKQLDGLVKEKNSYNSETGAVPQDVNRDLTLCREEINNSEQLLKKIEHIFELPVKNGIETCLTEEEHEYFWNNCINQEFSIIPEETIEDGISRLNFNQLLYEQKKVLDFVMDSNTISINGGAGTGKTVIAIEACKRLAKQDQSRKVLYLCLNTRLRNDVKNRLKSYSNISVMNMYDLKSLLINQYGASNNDDCIKTMQDSWYLENKCPYNDIIIDEGQDFGEGKEDYNPFMNTFFDIVNDDPELTKTLYIFYDEFQILNGGRVIPEAIQKVDTKVTLTKNCRNTTNIALASLQILTSVKDSIMKRKIETRISRVEGYVDGLQPQFYFLPKQNNKNDIMAKIRYIVLLDSWAKLNSIAILSCKPATVGLFQEEQKKGYIKIGNKDLIFANCNTFKGCEADGIILIECDKYIIQNQPMKYYVGASRAKTELAIISDISEAESTELLTSSYCEKINPGKNSKIQLARYLKTKGYIVD